jgi:hypothetical protein
MKQCPSVQLGNSYNFDKLQTTRLSIIPTAFLYCNGIFYQPQFAEWQSVDSLTGKIVLNLLNQPIAPSLNTSITPSTPQVNQLMGGFSQKVQVKVNL